MRTVFCCVVICLITVVNVDASRIILNSGETVVFSTTVSSSVLQFDHSELFHAQFDPSSNPANQFALPGEGSILVPGQPVLPSVSRFVVVPSTAGLTLTIDAGTADRHSSDVSPTLFENDEISYGADQFQQFDNGYFPPVVAEMSTPVIIRGVRMVKITTYPVQYHAQTNSYLVHNRISAEINYTDDNPVNPAVLPVRRHRSKEFLKFICNFAINGDQVGRDDPDDETDYVGHYLVVTHERCLEYIAPFIEWRRKSGYKVEILSLISNVAMSQNRVKLQIQDIYDDYLDDGVDPFDQLLLVGDRTTYTQMGNGQFILAAERGNTISNDANHADYLYACLEGNDHHPEVGFARFPAGREDVLELVVGRTLAYEAHPYMEETEWFDKGAVYSQHWGQSEVSAWHISIASNVRWGLQVLDHLGFNDVEFFEDLEWDQNAARIGPWFEDIYNEGRNVLIGRAQLWNWQRDFNGVENNVIFPINIATNGIGDWSGNHMFRTGDGDNLKGPVALTFCYGDSPTIPMSGVWMEMVNGLLLNDLSLGWARLQGITGIVNYVNNFDYNNQPIYLHVKSDIEAFGDPGIQPWIGVPRTVEIVAPEIVTPETRMLEVRVFDPDQEVNITGAQVTFYAPGAMPDFDADEYADYAEMIMMTATSNADGVARVVFEEGTEFTPQTPMFITVTGRDILPHFTEIEIQTPAVAIELADYALVETEGNDNGSINPGETFTLSLTVVNVGDEESAENVTAVVSCLSPWIEIGDNEVEFGVVHPGETDEGAEPVSFTISASCPDGSTRPLTKPTLLIEFTSDDVSWSSAIMLNPEAPNLEVVSIPEGNVVVRGEATDLDLEIYNIGALDSPELTVMLHSFSPNLLVIEGESSLPSIPDGEVSGLDEDFLISTNAMSIPGEIANMALILLTEAGFVDTALFQLQIGEPTENAPSPPDEYGYICFDDSDEDWALAPVYDWIEISLQEDERDFDGELLEFEGESEHDMGEALVMPLEFTAQFYGYEYDEITVSTNGFITMGEHEMMSNFQNWPMDRGIGGLGMIAPLWDWLKFNDNSAIYSYYDEDDALFIIEWYRLRHIEGDDIDQTFQVVIYDPDVWINMTGDSNILIQYKSVTNVRGPEQGRAAGERNIYYASVGISSPDGTTGVNYTFDNFYTITSANLENNRALFFTTSQIVRQARIFGRVTDAETGEPIEGVMIYTINGSMGFTDENGAWELLNVLAEIPFVLTFRAEGYNELTVEIEGVAEGDELMINVELLHPELIPSQESFAASLDPFESVDFEFDVSNTGNGPLTWNVTCELRGDANADPWELRQSYHIGAAMEDDKIMGVVFADEEFYATGANNSEPVIYRFDRDGDLISVIRQPIGEDRYGMRDLGWDGDLLWSSFENRVYGMTPRGEVITEFEVGMNAIVNITWDPDREALWMCGITSNPLAFNRNGEPLLDQEGNQLQIDRNYMRIYGLAYYPQDPDDHPLYIFHRERDTNRQILHKADPNDGDVLFVHYLDPEEGGSPQGCFITDNFDLYSSVFISIANSPSRAGGDRIDIWQLAVLKDWMRVEPTEGVIEPENNQQFVLTLSADDLVPNVYIGELAFHHNAAGGETRLEISMEIGQDLVDEPLIGEIPTEFKFQGIYPNPFNAQTRISFALPERSGVNLSVHNLLGREVAKIFGGQLQAGYHSYVWNAENAPSGIYFMKLVANGDVAIRKATVIK